MRIKWENASQVFGIACHVVSTQCSKVLLLKEKQLYFELRLGGK